jgi:FtsH-binding integral membrane protein
MPVSDDVRFEQRFEYHHHLEARQWQYFAAFLLLNSVLLNAFKDIQAAEPRFRIALPVSVIVAVAVFMRLIGRTRRRMRANDVALNKLAGERILDPGEPRTINVAGITFWLYVAMLAITSPWLILLYTTSMVWFIVIAACFVIYLAILIPWTHPQTSESNESEL